MLMIGSSIDPAGHGGHERGNHARCCFPDSISNASSAFQCLETCRQEFLFSIGQTWPPQWPQLCENLTTTTTTTATTEITAALRKSLWALYWCDSRFCGVWVNQSGPLGQDPQLVEAAEHCLGLSETPANVDWIIDTCQNNGYDSVIDPGPPATEFGCHIGAPICPSTNPSSTAEAVSTTKPNANSTIITTEASSNFHGPMTAVALGSADHVGSETQPTRASTPSVTVASSTPVPSSTARVTMASDSTQSTSAPVSAVGSSVTAKSAHRDLSTGARIAIAVSSVAGLAAVILGLMALVCRRRRRRRRQHGPKSRNLSYGPETQHASWLSRDRDEWLMLPDSPTNVASPLQSVAGRGGDRSILTPPLRLNDRKFLPSTLGPSSPSPPLTSPAPTHSPVPSHISHRSSPGQLSTLQPAARPSSAVFPVSPVTSPTIAKLVPRHDRFPRLGALSSTNTDRRHGTPSGAGAPSPARPATILSSLRNQVIPAPSPPTHQHLPPVVLLPSSSPTRPPRPHESPLEIPDLLTPSPPLGLLSDRPNRDEHGPTNVVYDDIRKRWESWGSWSGSGDNGRITRLPEGVTCAEIGIATSAPGSEACQPHEREGVPRE